eukprot:SAG31_NODE_5137_length_2720_cov_1.492560_2_plen_151_part_00
MTNEQRAAFLRAAAGGQLEGAGEAIQPWKPWWDGPAQHRPTIVEVGNDDSHGDVCYSEKSAAERTEKDPSKVETEAGTGLTDPIDLNNSQYASPPALPPASALPKLADLAARRKPSPALRFHLVELIYAYTCKFVWCTYSRSSVWHSSIL